MSIEIRVPALPESVADATILKWHKKAGDSVERDETLVELETDKVVLEVPAPVSGVLAEITAAEGATVLADALLGKVNAGAVAAQSAKPAEEKKSAPAAAQTEIHLSPAVRRAVAESDINVQGMQGSGKGGRIVKEDLNKTAAATLNPSMPAAGLRTEERVPMTRLRAKIAERLVEAQHNAAMLTTFNEINMQPVMDLRNRYKEQFEKTHGVKLGFMSFFYQSSCGSAEKISRCECFY